MQGMSPVPSDRISPCLNLFPHLKTTVYVGLDGYADMAVSSVHESTTRASSHLSGTTVTQIVAFLFMYLLDVSRSLYDRVSDRDDKGINFNTSIEPATPESGSSASPGRCHLVMTLRCFFHVVKLSESVKNVNSGQNVSMKCASLEGCLSIFAENEPSRY